MSASKSQSAAALPVAPDVIRGRCFDFARGLYPLSGGKAGKRTMESFGERHVAGLIDGPCRVEGDLPAMLVRIDDITAKAAMRGGIARA